jgi:hypothetical protein
MNFDVGKLETGAADRVDLQFAFLAGARKASFEEACGPADADTVRSLCSSFVPRFSFREV